MENIETLTKSKKVRRDISPMNVLVAYCELQDINLGYFLDNNKDSVYTHDRKICAFIISRLLKTNQKEIGHLFNRTNNSSISQYIKEVKEFFNDSEGFRKEYIIILNGVCAKLSK